MIMNYVLFNFEILDKDRLQFPYDDAGFLYGYGLFETIRIHRHTTPLLPLHLKRLETSAQLLGLCLPEFSKIEQGIAALIKINHAKDAILNIYLTGGSKTKEFGIFSKPESLLMVIRPLHSTGFLKIGLSPLSFSRNILSCVKNLSWIQTILEKQRHPEWDDILFYNAHGELLETCKSSVFFIQENALITPVLGEILPGIFRQHLLSSAREIGFSCHETPVHISKLNEMEEIFLTNAIQGIVSIKSVDNYPKLKSEKKTELLKEKFNFS